MKQKLTSLILTLVLLVSMSVPAFAAERGCPTEALLCALLCRRCGGADVNALLEQLLAQYPARPAAQETPQPDEPQSETPAPQPEQNTPQPEQSAPTSSAYEREVIRLVNAERAKAGLAPLAEDAALTRTARMKSQDMHDRGYFDHNSPTYGTPFQLMRSQGITYRTAGENIAMGYRTPEAVVSAWMNSSGHRANILNASYTKLGVGYVAEGNYWTQHFAG